jgi:hypothetical protein
MCVCVWGGVRLYHKHAEDVQIRIAKIERSPD